MIWWPVIVVFLVGAGKLWEKLPLVSGRTAAWLALLAGVVCIERELAGADPILRMVGVCCGLLGGLKGVVYREWSGRERKTLPWKCYLGFGLGWFGMDPEAFSKERKTLEWKRHLYLGLICMAVGTAWALVVRNAGWTGLLVVFVPMSLGFHYGALRVLTAFWRACGVPVRVLFRNPLVTIGLGDFWARRWNLAYSEMMIRVVKRPLEPRCGRRWAEGVVFLVSGLLHELAITVPVGAGYGWPTTYFLLNGIAVRLERLEWPLVVRRLWAFGWVVGAVGILFPKEFHHQVILRCLHVLPKLTELFPN